MSNWIYKVKDANTGNPIPNAYINVTISTTPATKNWVGSNTTSGAGYPNQGYTDSTGTKSFTIPYTCPQSISGTISASGYNDLPIDYTSGVISGDVDGPDLNFNMTAASLSPPPGQGITAGLGAGQTSTQISTAFSDAGGTIADWFNNIYVTVAIIGVAIAIVALLVILFMVRSGGL